MLSNVMQTVDIARRVFYSFVHAVVGTDSSSVSGDGRGVSGDGRGVSGDGRAVLTKGGGGEGRSGCNGSISGKEEAQTGEGAKPCMSLSVELVSLQRFPQSSVPAGVESSSSSGEISQTRKAAALYVQLERDPDMQVIMVHNCRNILLTANIPLK